jgi:uncharacterized protein
MLIGVISDTHGLLRPEAVEALRGVERIIHAGDIGKPEVITALEALAPVTAVRGNVDSGEWSARFPVRQLVSVGDQVSILVLHNLNDLKHGPPDQKLSVIISGHTHSPVIAEREGTLYINPGSAGRKRFKLPVTLALLKVEGTQLLAELVPLV